MRNTLFKDSQRRKINHRHKEGGFHQETLKIFKEWWAIPGSNQ
ncbi:hypothetical protein [Vibrio vulnificus YJ016]|uniref:Uncharacterized protein n=1 Tax=Vibrio vulnificus (strain YJ016) TaxID=196600 RepID=Q7MNJ9_VIBVY|nr:hypothetical protein [Vibrio vulnificus YJ016]